MSELPHRRLSAILAADIVGYSRLMGEDQVRTLEALRHFRRERFEPMVGDHQGNIVKNMGDGWLVEFTTVADAVTCAMAIQETLRDHEILKLRIGLHIGDVVHADEDIYGDGVNIAARLQEAGVPGAVLISHDVWRQLDGRRKGDFPVIGETKLKNISEPVTIAIWPEAAASEMTTRKAGQSRGKPTLTVSEFIGRGDDESIADGIKDDLIAVLSRQSGFHYTLQADQADYVIKGTVRSVRDRCRVSASLIDQLVGRQIWATRREADLADPFALQDECVYRICAGIRTFLWEEEGRKAAARPIDDLSTDEVLALGSHYLHQQTLDSFFVVYRLMDRVLENDPENFMALAMSAMAAMTEFHYGYREPEQDVAEEAKSRSDRAVRANNNSDYAHCVQAYVDVNLRHDHDGGAIAARRCIEINSNFSFGHSALGLAFTMGGDYRDGLAAIDQAITADPDNPFLHLFLRTKALGFFGLTEYAQAAEWFRQADKLMPGLPMNLLGLIASLHLMDNRPDSKVVLNRLITAEPEIRIRNISLPPFRDEGVTTLIRDSLRAAGVPD